VLLAGTAVSAIMLATIGLVPRFWVVVMLLVLWALMFAAMTPVREAYLNGLIESRERATVLSFDSLLASSGAAVAQPALGRVADVWSYPASYVWSGVIHAIALPFIWLARREKGASDTLGTARGTQGGKATR
jgi:MFS family permease